MDFDYKKYSLEQLSNWVHDAINCDDISATEVYNTITSVVEEQIDYHAQNLSNLRELYSLLNGKNVEKHYEPSMPPWGHSDMGALKYKDEELEAMCDAAEAEEKKKHLNHDEAIAAGWTMTDDGFWIRENKKIKKDTVKKWVLPVESSYIDGEEDYFLSLPDDLLNIVEWKEGDQLEWVSQDDNSYILKKVTNEK